MPDQYRATDNQWHWQAIKKLLPENPRSPLPACLIELHNRIQRLESAQQVPVTSSAADRVLALQDRIRDGALSLADALKEIGAPAASRQPHTLVDRVANAIYNVPFDSDAEARAAIREVAAWLRSEYPRREGYGNAWANLLDDHAGQ